MLAENPETGVGALMTNGTGAGAAGSEEVEAENVPSLTAEGGLSLP